MLSLIRSVFLSYLAMIPVVVTIPFPLLFSSTPTTLTNHTLSHTVSHPHALSLTVSHSHALSLSLNGWLHCVPGPRLPRPLRQPSPVGPIGLEPACASVAFWPSCRPLLRFLPPVCLTSVCRERYYCPVSVVSDQEKYLAWGKYQAKEKAWTRVGLPP